MEWALHGSYESGIDSLLQSLALMVVLRNMCDLDVILHLTQFALAEAKITPISPPSINGLHSEKKR